MPSPDSRQEHNSQLKFLCLSQQDDRVSVCGLQRVLSTIILLSQRPAFF